MKLQNLTIIFILIMVPILLVVSYYIGLQIDTLNKQTAYDTKLQEATGEAIKALEINTVEWNYNFEELADSKRRDVNASINTFVSSIANKMGVGGSAKEFVSEYIPSVVYTLYDGYYVYAKSNIDETEVTNEGVAQKNNIGQLETTGNQKYEHLLQSFTPYSETLVNNNDNVITINYTLDNFVRVYGIVNGNPCDLEGYLTIDDRIDFTSGAEIGSGIYNVNNVKYNEQDLTNGERLTERIYYINANTGYLENGNFNYVYDSNNIKYYWDGHEFFYLNSKNKQIYVSTLSKAKYKKIVLLNASGQNINCYQSLKEESGNYDLYDAEGNLIAHSYGDILNDYSGRNYCIESKAFTAWFNANIGSKNWTKEINGTENSVPGTVFTISGVNNPDPEAENEYNISDFTTHKREIMKNLINDSLVRVVTEANMHLADATYEYRLPELSYEDWDKILSNISIVGFLQGIPIGLKYYNNYAIASSANNNEYVDPAQIFLSSDDDTYYHRRGCSALTHGNVTGYRSTDYIMRTFKAEAGNKYYYMHENGGTSELACYKCLVNRDSLTNYDAYRQEYYTALARERYVAQSQITPTITIPITPPPPPPAATYAYTIEYIDMADHSSIHIENGTVDVGDTKYVVATDPYYYGGNSYTLDASSPTDATITETNNEIKFYYNKVVTPVVASFSVKAIACADGSSKDRDGDELTIDGNLEVGTQRGVRITAASGTSVYENGYLIHIFTGEAYWDHIYGTNKDFGEKHIYSLEDGSEAITVRDWTIACEGDLKTFRDDYVNSGEVLPNIIDVINDFTAEDFANNSTELIGTDSNKFNKTFEGNNHTIIVNGTGLFAYNKGTIQNLNINATIEGTGNVGGVVAYNEGTISKVSVSGNIKNTSTTIDLEQTNGNTGVGGITGFNDIDTTIEKCTNNAKVQCNANGGGIAGVNFGGTIEYCINNGEINCQLSGSTTNRIGGICRSAGRTRRN